MNHLSKLAAQLDDYQLDGMLITSAPGERYALNFHGEGYVLVTKSGVHYSTDGRYIEAAQAQLTGVELVQTTKEQTHLVLASQYVKTHNIQQLGFESGRVSVDQLRQWEQAFSCQLIPAQGLIDQLRASKDEEELAAMRQAQHITDQVFEAILPHVRPGVTEQEIAARLVYEMLRRGAERPSFNPIVAAGPNGSRPHAIPGDRVLESGMFVTMDFGCVWNGYCSDMTRTVALGTPTDEMKTVYHTVLEAQKAGISAARGGITGQELDNTARQVIEKAGYGPYFSHSFGHSLGIEIHEPPNAAPTVTTPLPVGAVVSAEPGIYLPGRFGVRIEDVIILTETGCEDITQSPKELIVL